MSLIYWENVLADPSVPFDITFRIVAQDGHGDDGDDVTHGVDGASAGPAGSVSMISAHKLILGLTSPVFKSQLYGRWKDSGDEVIEVRDVTFEAFRSMVNYMYGMPLRYSVEFLTLEKAQELFDIVYAAKKYLIPQLTGEIVALINKAAITTNTVEVQQMERMAEKYSHLEEASSALLAKCEEERETAIKEATWVSGKERVRSSLTVTVQESLVNVVPVNVELGQNINIDIEVEPNLVLQPVPMIPQLFGDLDILEVSNDIDDNNVGGDTEDVQEMMFVGDIVQENEADQAIAMENGQFDDSLVDHTDQINLGS